MAKNKNTAKDWLQRIKCAQKVKEEWRKRFRISTCYDFWEGIQRPPHIPDEEWSTINMIYSNLMAELPTMYSTDPYFYVKLKKSYSINPMDIVLYETKGRIRQSMLNYLKGELKLKPKIRLSIFDAYFQYGIQKIHYTADLVKNDKAGMMMMHETGEMMMDDTGMPIIEPDYIPANEAYKVTRVHPDDFLVDEDAGPLDENVSWKAQRIKEDLEEVKKDKKYRASARRQVQATECSEEAQKERERRKKGTVYESEEKDQADVCVLWEVYDLKKNQWFVVSEGCNEFLIEPRALPEGIEGDPYVDLRFTLRDDSWYPLPPVSQWIDAQRDYCEIRSKLKTHRKRFNRKYTMYAPGFDDPEMSAAKLESGDDGTILLQNQQMQTVYPIQDAPLDQQVHTEYAYTRQDFNDLAVGPNQRGSGSGVDSATEAGILERRTQVREGDKISMVMDFMVDVGRKLDQLVQVHISEDQAVKISGPQGEIWEAVKVDGYDEIAGEYEYSVDVGSVTPQLPEIERAQWMAFLGLVSQSPQLLLSKSLIRKMAELHHISTEDPLIDELYKIAVAMMQGQLPMPGQQGSQPGVPQMNPQAVTGGTAAGVNNIRGGQQ